MKKRQLTVLFIVSIWTLLLSWSLSCRAQLSNEDLELLRNRDFKDQLPPTKSVTTMLIGKNAVTRYNPVSLLFTGSLYFYQKIISPQIGADCPYEISCSEFSRRCIQEYGLVKGVALAADRLTRCNQIAAYDIHPMLINDKRRIDDAVELYRFKD